MTSYSQSTEGVPLAHFEAHFEIKSSRMEVRSTGPRIRVSIRLPAISFQFRCLAVGIWSFADLCNERSFLDALDTCAITIGALDEY